MGLADRTPPQNLEAELSVLGSCLLENERIDEVNLIIRSKDEFFRANHAELFGEIVSVYESGQPVDGQTLAERLMKLGRFHDLGGTDMIEKIVQTVPHAANASYYANIVHEKWIVRQAIGIATEIIKAGFSNEHTAEELIGLAQQKFFSLTSTEIAGAITDASMLMDEAQVRFFARESGEIVGLETLYSDLDARLMGIQPGDLVILAARPSMGKTTLAGNIAERVAGDEKGGPVLFVSIEMPRHQIGDRLISSRSGLSGDHIKFPNSLSQEQRAAFFNAAENIKKLPFFIDDTPVRTLTQITAAARQIKRKNGLALIVVDYLSKIRESVQGRESRQETVARISAGLKEIARKLEVPVLCLHQLNRNAENREDHRPRMADLRESGAVEADADIVLLLHRPEYYNPNDSPGIAEVEIAKNRTGETGTVKLVFNKRLTRFDSIAFDNRAPNGQPF